MADSVRIELDLSSGKLSLDCPESSVDAILANLADFLPRFRNHAQPALQQTPNNCQSSETEKLESISQTKAGNGLPESGLRRRSPAAVRSAAAPEARVVVQNLQLNVDEPDLLPWGSLDKDWKKYLWILEAARVKGIDGLTNSEISYLMDKTFREVRAPKVVNNLKKKIKDRYVQPSSVNVEGKTYSIWRILADGSKEVVEPAGKANA